MNDRYPSIAEQEYELEQKRKANAEQRKFDEGFAEYEQALADEELRQLKEDDAA